MRGFELIRNLSEHDPNSIVVTRSDKDKSWIKEVKKTESLDCPSRNGAKPTRVVVIVPS